MKKIKSYNNFRLRSANLKNFEKHYLREFLVFLSNMKINPPKEFVEDVRDNPKIMENLTLFDIYLYLHTFKEAKVEFAKTYFHLYYA